MSRFDWTSKGGVTFDGRDYAYTTQPDRAKWIADCLNACEQFGDADPAKEIEDLKLCLDDASAHANAFLRDCRKLGQERDELRNEVERLESEAERLRRENEGLRGINDDQAKCIAKMRAENERLRSEAETSRNEVERLREALRFYADPGNYLADDEGRTVATAWQQDRVASKARAALSETSSRRGEGS